MGMGFFDDSTPGWKTPLDKAWDPAPAVPVPDPNALTVDKAVAAPTAAPAASVSPQDQRQQALSSAIGNVYGGAAPTSTADANIAAQVPYVDPLNNPDAQQYAVGGGTQGQSVGSTKLSPEAKKAGAEARAEGNKVADAKIAEGNLAMSNAEQLAQQQQQQAEQLNQQAQENLAKQTAIQKRVDETMQQQQKDTDEYLKAVGSIDPNRMMKGGRGVMAAIASGLGAFGASLTHSENGAQHIIDNAIARDWQQQKDAADSKRYKAEATGKLVSQLRQSLSDEQSVQLAHSAAVRNAMAMQLDSLATKLKGTEAAANATTLAGSLRQQAAQAYAEMLGRETVNTSTSTQIQIVPFNKTSQYDSVMDAALRNEKRNHDLKEARGQLPTGPETEAGIKAKESVATGLNILRPLNEFRKELQGSMGAGMDASLSMDATKRDQLRQMVKIAVGKMVSGAAMSEQEGQRIENSIFGERVFGSDALDTLVKTYSNFLARDIKTRVDLLHPDVRDAAWKSIQESTSPADYRMLHEGQLPDDNEKAAKHGGTVRGESKNDKVKAAVSQRFGGRLDSK